MKRLGQSMHRFSSSSVAAAAGTPVRRSRFAASVFQDGSLGLESEQGSVRLHPLWLREHTMNPSVMHVESRQRLFEASDFCGTPSGVLQNAWITDSNQLRVVFEDGFEDEFDPEAILMEAKDSCTIRCRVEGSDSLVPLSLSLPEQKLWGEEFAGKVQPDMLAHEFETVSGSDEGMQACMETILTWGAAIIKNTPGKKDEYKAFLGRLGIIRQTNWGTWFEVVAAPKSAEQEDASLADAAFSNLGIPLHTDGPYNTNPLLYQVLQCLKQSPDGGASSLSDGIAAAKALERSDPEAFKILATTKVRFHYTDKHNELLTERPMISRDCDGEVDKVFFSGRLDATPVAKSPQETDRFYRAKQKFVQELYRPDRVMNFKLEEADMLIFSNTRLLHGRTGFSTDTPPTVQSDGLDDKKSSKTKLLHEQAAKDGLDLTAVSRYLRGCYLDAIDCKYRVTKRNVGLRQWAPSRTRAMHTSSKRWTSDFTQLKDCTEDDVALMNELYSGATSGEKLASRALGIFQLLNRAGPLGHHVAIDDTNLGFRVDLYEHGLQTATRCHRAGCDEEIVVAGLLHDMGELLSPSNHGEFSAALLRPFVSPHVSWMLEHHEVFQMYYYNDKCNPPKSRDVREVYKTQASSTSHGVQVDVPHAYNFTVDFCENFDQASFDPNYSSMELAEFEPMVRRVFSRNPYWHSPNHPKRGAVTGL